MVVIGAGDSSCGNISDPINLAFRGWVSLPEIARDLQTAGWSTLSPLRGHLAASLYLCDINHQNPERQRDQLVNGQPWDRYHIRLWDVASLPGGINYQRFIISSIVVAAAHHEVFAFPGVHRVTAHESGKWKVAFDLSHVPAWRVLNDAEFTGNFNLVPFSNDYATVIWWGYRLLL